MPVGRDRIKIDRLEQENIGVLTLPKGTENMAEEGFSFAVIPLANKKDILI